MQVMKHCGATTVPRTQLDRNPTVPITASHNPLNHSILPNMVEAKLAEFGWTVRDFDAGLSHDECHRISSSVSGSSRRIASLGV